MSQPNIQYGKKYTPQECEELLAAIDEELERREGRIKIATREHWQVKRAVSRAIGVLWARQVEQTADGVCDSPYIQVLERRATTDLAEQSVDYDRIVNDIGHIADICQDRLRDLGATLEAEEAYAACDVEVDLGNAGSLSGEAQEGIASHDRGVLTARRQARVQVTKDRVAAWQAALKHAEASLATAKSDKRQAETMVRSNYSQQAQDHIKWAMGRKGLKSPFLLPGALAGVPILDFDYEEVK